MNHGDPLKEKVHQLGIIASEDCFVPGFGQKTFDVLHIMMEPIPDWQIDVLYQAAVALPVSLSWSHHSGPTEVSRGPLHDRSRSYHPSDWVNRVDMVDELWVPSNLFDAS